MLNNTRELFAKTSVKKNEITHKKCKKKKKSKTNEKLKSTRAAKLFFFLFFSFSFLNAFMVSRLLF